MTRQLRHSHEGETESETESSRGELRVSNSLLVILGFWPFSNVYTVILDYSVCGFSSVRQCNVHSCRVCESRSVTAEVAKTAFVTAAFTRAVIVTAVLASPAYVTTAFRKTNVHESRGCETSVRENSVCDSIVSVQSCHNASVPCMRPYT